MTEKLFIGGILCLVLWAGFRSISRWIANRKFGFTNKVSGRGGYIRYREHDCRLDIGVELTTDKNYEYCVSASGWYFWTSPENKPIPIEKQVDIADQLEEWIKFNGLRWQIIEDPNFRHFRSTNPNLKKRSNTV